VDEKVDLIFAVPTAATVQAKAAVRGTNIPLVFAYAGLEGSDLVESVQKPGGNLTGVCYPGSDQIAKRLEILLELAPKVKRIGITYDKNYPNTIPSLKVLRQIAMSRDLALVEVPVAGLEELKSALTDLKKSSDIGMDAVMLMPDSLNHSPQGWMEIKTFAAQYHLPLAGSFFYTVENGAVFGNSNDLFKVGELVAPLADKIFRGIPAGTIPVVTPEQDLWINYKVAQELGLTVPEDMLRRADKIIR
jgi:putative ABC transport system substrate-binding protein